MTQAKEIPPFDYATHLQLAACPYRYTADSFIAIYLYACRYSGLMKSAMFFGLGYGFSVTHVSREE